jgi:hydrogenase maturation factor
MCMSRLYRVVRSDGGKTVDVEDVEGSCMRASLLALDGDPPSPGDWVVVHSGYVIDRADSDEAQYVAVMLRESASRSSTIARDEVPS